ncbi:MAG: cofactor-independent phosphoglycerate mutase [Candidatus Omnitrophica bacterium]|nr:cofactor-independent phosphoglycerate mutase [Candidatus Omnitrophota bacterium]
MKYILLIPTGLSDEPIPSLDGKTPLEVAQTPNLDFLAKHGKVGRAQHTPRKFYPGTDVTSLSVLGYNPEEYYTGRGALEAAHLGVKLGADEVAFRVNLVTVDGEKLVDYNAGQITTKESRALIAYLNKTLSNDAVRFVPGLTYRHLAIFKCKHGLTGLSAACEPPHLVVGKAVEEHFPKGPGEELLAHVMRDSRKLLRDHEVNQVRVDLGENPAGMIWLWGQGVTPNLPNLTKRFGVRGALIAAVNLVRGLGHFAGLDVLNVEGATGYVDTNFESKGQKAVEALEKYDFVCIHIEAMDEAGHEGNVKLKIQCIEQFDRYIVGPVRKFAQSNKDTRILVAPDHGTSSLKRVHLREAAPVLLYGAGVQADEIVWFNEEAARHSNWSFAKGHELMNEFIRKSGSSLRATSQERSRGILPRISSAGRDAPPTRSSPIDASSHNDNEITCVL